MLAKKLIGKYTLANIVALIAGIIVGNIFQKEVIVKQHWAFGGTVLAPYVNVDDVICMAIGFAIFLVGYKVHRLVKWFGLGMFLGVLANKVAQNIWRT